MPIRIGEMAYDVEKQLITTLQVQKCALKIDESTLSDTTAILMTMLGF